MKERPKKKHIAYVDLNFNYTCNALSSPVKNMSVDSIMNAVKTKLSQTKAR